MGDVPAHPGVSGSDDHVIRLQVGRKINTIKNGRYKPFQHPPGFLPRMYGQQQWKVKAPHPTPSMLRGPLAEIRAVNNHGVYGRQRMKLVKMMKDIEHRLELGQDKWTIPDQFDTQSEAALYVNALTAALEDGKPDQGVVVTEKHFDKLSI